MNATPDQREAGTANSEREHVRLLRRVDSMRSVLVRLLQEVVRAECRLDNSQAAQLLEANERLVVTALSAQSDAERAAQLLSDMSRVAELDALTQLPNRLLLLDRLMYAIATARRHRARLALLFLDLDGFKRINDTFGHTVGDQVLRRIATCLSASVRAVDTVGRLGGDEFLILLTEVSQPSDAGLIAAKVIAAIGAPGVAGEHVPPLSASIGICIYPDDGEDPDTLIDRADAAMYQAKRHRSGSFAFHGQTTAGPSGLEPPRPPASQPVTRHAQAMAEQERQNAQLREANGQLVKAALSAQELQAAAEQAQRRQAEFMAAVVQELRDPSAPIRIATAMLGRARTDEPLLPRVQAIVDRQVAQISSLVGDLLDVSRVGTGTLEVKSGRVDMAGLIDTAADGWRPVMNARRQQFEVRLPAGALDVRGDAARLAQIVGNLLDNASRYAPEGGEIALVVVVQGDELVMTVSDNGMGITAQALPNVFEPFMQETHAIGLDGRGPGIGLTVVRALVHAHGGSVVARSAGSGRGSQFVVTLPLHGGPAQAGGGPSAIGVPDGSC